MAAHYLLNTPPGSPGRAGWLQPSPAWVLMFGRVAFDGESRLRAPHCPAAATRVQCSGAR